jgi:competence protein ComEC
MLVAKSKFTRSFAIIPLAALVWCLCWTIGDRPSNEPATITFLSVGQGDCSVVTSDSETVLIDAGPKTPTTDAGKEIVVPWLKHHGITTVQAILLSHPDADHVGGTPSILAAYPAAHVLISDQFKADPAMLAHLEKWNLSSDRVTWLPHFSAMKLGELFCFLDCPDRPLYAGTNDGSMFVRISEGNGSVTFTGDAPKAVEQRCEHESSWESEIIHIGHHGSKTATDPTWLTTVHPRYAIISVGRNNRYGLPSREVLARINRAGIRIYRTDQDGSVTFRFYGSQFEHVSDY